MAWINRSSKGGRWTLERVLEFFPRLGERLNNGGHQLHEASMSELVALLREGRIDLFVGRFASDPNVGIHTRLVLDALLDDPFYQAANV